MPQAAFKAGHAESLLVLVHNSQHRTLAWFSVMIFDMDLILKYILCSITIYVNIPKNHTIFSVTIQKYLPENQATHLVPLANKRLIFEEGTFCSLMARLPALKHDSRNRLFLFNCV
jgi:hypothetical protein